MLPLSGASRIMRPHVSNVCSSGPAWCAHGLSAKYKDVLISDSDRVAAAATQMSGVESQLSKLSLVESACAVCSVWSRVHELDAG